MTFIIGIVVLLAFIGIGLRISRATGLPFRYIIICIVCWIIGAIFIITSVDFSGIELIITIAVVAAFPIILILVTKLIFRFFKWAIGGIVDN